MKIRAAVFSAMFACATVPLREQECYESLLDYYAGNKKGYCDENEEPPRLFEKTYIVKTQGDNMKIIYLGEVDGRGYCLIPSDPYYSFAGYRRIRSFCTFGSGTLDACIWEDSDIVLQLRSENPGGCRDIPWDDLESSFEYAKFEFVRMVESRDAKYFEAAERVRFSSFKVPYSSDSLNQ